MTYGEALEFLNEGHCVSRSNWIHQGDTENFICKQILATIDSSKILGMQSLPDTAKTILTNWKINNINYIDQLILVGRNGYITYYIPNSEDIFATDWICYE